MPEVPQPVGTHSARRCRRKGRGKADELDPLSLPANSKPRSKRSMAITRRPLSCGKKPASSVPPCFIVVCNNTSTSKLVYDYISGFDRKNEDGTDHAGARPPGALPQFRRARQPARRARARLLIDSEQLESGEALDDNFRDMAADEIERFRREIVERTGDQSQAENISDQDLLREVMNTVGKQGRLGEAIRCVVSVSMLTEGWDANTVTHVLGVRAFGTQLLCEQVIGRALRRQSYDLNEDGLFNVEYADVLGIPFDFTAKPVVAPPQPPRETIQVRAVRARTRHLEIRFPASSGYRVELPEERLDADLQRRLAPGADARSGRPFGHPQRGHHRRRRRSHPDTHRRRAPLHPPVPSDPATCSTPNGAIPAKSPSCISSAS